ncbi:MAG: co-chaperone GroES [Chitinispirillaceae bacterium]|jgi:chaperonin GroES|nr:co-chaperone GroES [Chitinispirillaceae bacterium]
MNVKPLADRIIIKQLEAEQKTAGGIIIPDNAKEKPQKGEVIAVGPGKIADNGQAVAMTLKKGDKVLYGKYTGTEVTVDGSEYLILRESDVLAVI